MAEEFHDVIVQWKIPRQWTESTIILFHKKAFEPDLNNYRSISISSNVHKLFPRILT